MWQLAWDFWFKFELRTHSCELLAHNREQSFQNLTLDRKGTKYGRQMDLWWISRFGSSMPIQMQLLMKNRQPNKKLTMLLTPSVFYKITHFSFLLLSKLLVCPLEDGFSTDYFLLFWLEVNHFVHVYRRAFICVYVMVLVKYCLKNRACTLCKICTNPVQSLPFLDWKVHGHRMSTCSFMRDLYMEHTQKAQCESCHVF